MKCTYSVKIAIATKCLPAETASESGIILLTLKTPNKNCSRRHFNFLLLSFEENKA